jgi:hypothetical protein
VCISAAKNAPFEQFTYKNDHFAKTGSGQTQEKLSKKGREKGLFRTDIRAARPKRHPTEEY